MWKFTRNTILLLFAAGGTVIFIFTIQVPTEHYWKIGMDLPRKIYVKRKREPTEVQEQMTPIDILTNISTNMTEKLLINSLQSKELTNRPKPRQSQTVILTTWRSGSTFLETVLSSHPGMYNIYEPLTHFGFNVIQDGDPHSEEATQLIHDLLSCRYNNDKYITKAKKITEMLSRNPRVWKACKPDAQPGLCYDYPVLENSCKLFPWTVMKLVRAGMSLLEPTLEDPKLNIHVIFLVRDPRGVMNSRINSVKWCIGVNCSSVSKLCEGMNLNIEVFKQFQIKFPGKVHLLRYEDMCLNPMDEIRDLLTQIDLQFEENIQEFIESSTKGGKDTAWGVRKNSLEKVTSWTKSLKITNLNEIQKTCGLVMEQFGYLPVAQLTNLTIQHILGPVNL